MTHDGISECRFPKSFDAFSRGQFGDDYKLLAAFRGHFNADDTWSEESQGESKFASSLCPDPDDP
jgi:hypothetical protein